MDSTSADEQLKKRAKSLSSAAIVTLIKCYEEDAGSVSHAFYQILLVEAHDRGLVN